MDKLNQANLDFIHKHEIKRNTDFCDTNLPTSVVKAKLLEMQTEIERLKVEEINRLKSLRYMFYNKNAEMLIDYGIDGSNCKRVSAFFDDVIHELTKGVTPK